LGAKFGSAAALNIDDVIHETVAFMTVRGSFFDAPLFLALRLASGLAFSVTHSH
jgi:hypothetical protein